ncbi:MAG: N-acetylmuramoyl-L-alanine amidase [Lachnospiraceae bacterium]|nr:N-acetylmuramoyl-L-alanine amidase [Lachnospiraceae bacterium]
MQLKVILDAGHGDEDPGKVGIDGTLEKNINLEIAKMVQKFLEREDIQVIMTREDDTIDVGKEKGSKKVADMKRRVALINEEVPAVIVSIHQNSYQDAAVNGPQTFYYTASKEGKELAGYIQRELVRTLKPGKEREIKENDTYYLLKKTNSSIVIVKCGFLSNPDEAKKLNEKKYQRRAAWAIQMGILEYLNSAVRSESAMVLKDYRYKNR